MSPMENGYSIYVGGNNVQGWVTRVYREGDDTHVHSTEGRGATIDLGLREASRAIRKDLDGGREEVAAVGRRPPLEASSHRPLMDVGPLPLSNEQRQGQSTNFNDRGDAA